MEGITVVESSSSWGKATPKRSFICRLYRTFLKTITWDPSYIFPSLWDNIQIVGLMNEITCTFDHLSIQLTLVGPRVKVQTLESITDLSKRRDSSSLHFGHIWLMHFGCANGFSKLCHKFFEWSFISKRGTYSWSSSPGRRPCCFGHFVLVCSSLTFLCHTDNTSFFLHVFFGKFWQDKKIMQVRVDNMGPRLWEYFQGPLTKH
jgi:hypothetical protein